MAASSVSQPVKRWEKTASSAPKVPQAAACEPARLHLRQLVTMRLVAIVVQLAAVVAADGLLGIDLPVPAMDAVLVALGIFNAWTWRRLHDPQPVTDVELLRQLFVDVIALTALLAMSGGTANPFASIFLLPLAIGATFLTWSRAWTLAIGTVACYSLLLFVSRPLAFRSPGSETFALLSAGMWVSYSITAIVVASILARVSSALRRDEKLMAEEREKAISNEHILRIGTLAAGAAHELSSPLGSIAIVIDDLRQRHAGHPEIGVGLETVARQLACCRSTLTTLLSYGNSTFPSRVERLPFDHFIRNCIESFASRRHGASIAMRIESEGHIPLVLANDALTQALTSLLDNAADVSPEAIEVRIGWDREWLRIGISDRGPGFPKEVADGLGKLFFTTKGPGKGNGLGLYLANTAVLRFGGSLTLANAEGGGAVVQITLPVSEMSSLDIDLRPRE